MRLLLLLLLLPLLLLADGACSNSSHPHTHPPTRTTRTISVQYLRDVKAILGVTFKITPDVETDTLLLSCLGSGYTNLNKKLK